MSSKLRAELSQCANDLDALMNGWQVCAFFGGISKMTVFRWVPNPASGFPPPFKIGQRNYWIRRDLISFRDMQRGRAQGAAGASRREKECVSFQELVCDQDEVNTGA
jgi:predicted DNA-binding transcriptional regulator AlpA